MMPALRVTGRGVSTTMTKMRLEDGTEVEIDGLHCPKVKGRRYVYDRKTKYRFSSDYGTWELVEEIKQYRASLPGQNCTRPGTWGGLVRAFKKSPEWRELAPRTRKDYDTRVFDWLKRMDDVPLERITGPDIFKLRDAAAKKSTRRANYVIQVMSRVFAWAMPRGLARSNPAAGVSLLKRDKSKPRANRPWTMAECRAVLDAAPVHLKVPIALSMFTGIREADALRLRWDTYSDGQFNFRPNKNDYDLWISPPPTLAAVLKTAPRNALTISVNSRGAQWTESGFRASWRKLRIKLENGGKVEAGLTIHGLRHTVGNVLADEGVSTEHIAKVLGITEKAAKIYSDRATRKRATSAAVVHLDKIGRRT
ncbi:MAG: site-specific recombinase [Maricaulis sp.]|nr:site-specific recombinase [Maricaulis sp.]